MLHSYCRTYSYPNEHRGRLSKYFWPYSAHTRRNSIQFYSNFKSLHYIKQHYRILAGDQCKSVSVSDQGVFTDSYLKLLATRRTQKVFAIGMAQHVEPEFVWAAEGFITFHALEYLLRVEAAHVLLYLLMITRTI